MDSAETGAQAPQNTPIEIKRMRQQDMPAILDVPAVNRKEFVEEMRTNRVPFTGRLIDKAQMPGYFFDSFAALVTLAAGAWDDPPGVPILLIDVCSEGPVIEIRIPALFCFAPQQAACSVGEGLNSTFAGFE